MADGVYVAPAAAEVARSDLAKSEVLAVCAHRPWAPTAFVADQGCRCHGIEVVLVSFLDEHGGEPACRNVSDVGLAKKDRCRYRCCSCRHCACPGWATGPAAGYGLEAACVNQYARRAEPLW